jgi:hypothetical protein
MSCTPVCMNSMRIRRLIIFASFALGLIGPADPAFAANDLYGARAMSLAGALRASATGAAALILNPAGMSLAPQYVIGANYQFRVADSTSFVHSSVVDSGTTKLAAGVSYTFIRSNPTQLLATVGEPFHFEETIDIHEVGLALSYPIGTWLILGLHGRYINYSSDVPVDAPDGLSPVNLSNVALDAGAILRLGESIRIAAVGYNLVPIHDQIYPQSLGTAVSYSSSSLLTIEFDALIDFTTDPNKITASFHGGVELTLRNAFAIRGGAMHQMHRNTTFVSAGFGYFSKRFGASIGLRQMVDGGSETQITTGAEYFIQ